MSDARRTTSSPEFESEREQRIWDALGQIDRPEPSAQLRRSFYRRLDELEQPGLLQRLHQWLGLRSHSGWLTVAACVMAGVLIGRVSVTTDTGHDSRIATLEQDVAMLNRQRVLDQLQAVDANTRLLGAVSARDIVAGDAELARALLFRASEDRVQSVRTAAIEALGPSVRSRSVGDEIMSMLQSANSPLVQLALVDLVLRSGSEDQLRFLDRLAQRGALHPDLVRHVETAFGRESI